MSFLTQQIFPPGGQHGAKSAWLVDISCTEQPSSSQYRQRSGFKPRSRVSLFTVCSAVIARPHVRKLTGPCAVYSRFATIIGASIRRSNESILQCLSCSALTRPMPDALHLLKSEVVAGEGAEHSLSWNLCGISSNRYVDPQVSLLDSLP